MNSPIQSHSIAIQGAKIHYLEAKGPDAPLSPEAPTPALLFLHGASFSAQTWREIGTLPLMAARGCRAIALDLPGYGKSQSLSGFRDSFLLCVLEALHLNRPVLVSPSMSGNYALPLVTSHPEQLAGWVAVAPVGIPQFRERLGGIELPTLAIWGSNDRIVPAAQADLLVQWMPGARKAILENAGHACYLRATEEFHQQLVSFVSRLEGKID